ncbi:MAG: alpha-L-fucosidase [Kiritimatiellia bacterium]
MSTPARPQHATRDDFPNAARGGVTFEHFTRERWDASNFATPDVVKTWRDRRYGMFIHFGITARAKSELSWGSINPRYAPDSPGIMANGEKRTEPWTTWPADMKLEKFNAREWVDIARRSGFKYIVVTTKHHEGFHMWDTAFSDFKITNTPFGRDYLKELTDACHEAGMPVGFYFAQREWYHPDYQPVDLTKVKINGDHWTLNAGETSPLGPRHGRYLEYQKNVIRELCTKYGKIDIWWWDAVTWGGMFTEEMWDSENMTRMIRELQPGIIINNRASCPVISTRRSATSAISRLASLGNLHAHRLRLVLHGHAGPRLRHAAATAESARPAATATCSPRGGRTGTAPTTRSKNGGCLKSATGSPCMATRFTARAAAPGNPAPGAARPVAASPRIFTCSADPPAG